MEIAGGPEKMVVSGSPVFGKYVHVHVSGVGSVLNDVSTARTWKVCWPGRISTYCVGEKHSSHTSSPSTEVMHSK